MVAVFDLIARTSKLLTTGSPSGKLSIVHPLAIPPTVHKESESSVWIMKNGPPDDNTVVRFDRHENFLADQILPPASSEVYSNFSVAMGLRVSLFTVSI